MDTNKKLLLFATSGLGIVLLSCCLGAVIIGAIALFGDPHPTKLVGVWKGPFGEQEIVYTFNKDGSFRQQSFKQGRQHFELPGQWGFRSGEISIRWSRDTFERGAVTWIDDNTFHYRIVAQDDERQIGQTTTFKRQ